MTVLVCFPTATDESLSHAMKDADLCKVKNLKAIWFKYRSIFPNPLASWIFCNDAFVVLFTNTFRKWISGIMFTHKHTPNSCDRIIALQSTLDGKQVWEF